VVRQPKAYPVYDAEYSGHVEVVRSELQASFPTFHPVGRNGMHKYNNQDHAMMTAMLTVENIVAGSRIFDTWRVNDDAEYHEEGRTPASATAPGARITPQRIR
jgi:protoporphyrinogen oxidase